MSVFGNFLKVSAVAVVLSACVANQSATTQNSQPAPVVTRVAVPFDPKTIKQTVNPEEITLYQGGQQSAMHYLVPQSRTAARALGFGGMAQYAVLRGKNAMLRVSDKQPVFLFAAPDHAQPDGYFAIANFAVRENGTREVIIGGGFMSYSTGIHPDRLVPCSIEKVSDQSMAPKGFSLYVATVNAPLPAGEYAVVFYSSQVRSAGFFSQTLDSYFDFGVDG